jgi:hypothetical protein
LESFEILNQILNPNWAHLSAPLPSPVSSPCGTTVCIMRHLSPPRPGIGHRPDHPSPPRRACRSPPAPCPFFFLSCRRTEPPFRSLSHQRFPLQVKHASTSFTPPRCHWSAPPPETAVASPVFTKAPPSSPPLSELHLRVLLCRTDLPLTFPALSVCCRTPQSPLSPTGAPRIVGVLQDPSIATIPHRREADRKRPVPCSSFNHFQNCFLI